MGEILTPRFSGLPWGSIPSGAQDFFQGKIAVLATDPQSLSSTDRALAPPGNFVLAPSAPLAPDPRTR